MIFKMCNVLWFCCNSVPKFSLNFSFPLRCFMNMALGPHRVYPLNVSGYGNCRVVTIAGWSWCSSSIDNSRRLPGIGSPRFTGLVAAAIAPRLTAGNNVITRTNTLSDFLIVYYVVLSLDSLCPNPLNTILNIALIIFWQYLLFVYPCFLFHFYYSHCIVF